MTQRIELFFNMTQRIEQLFMTHRIERLFEYDTKNWISFWGWFKESNSFLNTTRRMKRFFLNTTQWIEPSLTWLEDLIFFFEKKKMTHRIEISWAWVKNWIFEFFWKKKKTTQRIELFSKIRYKELNFFSIWLNFFSKYDSKNLTLHFTMTQRLCFFFWKKNQRIWLLWLTDLNLFFFWIFFQKKDWKNWAFFLNYDSQNVFFKYECDSRNWFFFFQYDSQNWSFFLNVTFFLTLNFFFLNSTQRIEISNTTQRNNFFSLICLNE